MSLDVGTLMNNVVDYVAQLGVVELVNKHEPVGNVGTKVASVWLQHIAPAREGSGLNATSVRCEFTLRIYSNMVKQPPDEVDPDLAGITSAVLGAFSGGFSLGNTVREVDLLGEFGNPLSAKAGYLNLSGALYRVMDITIPIVVDDVFAQVA